MASAYQFASLGSCGHSNLSHFYADYLPIFIYGLLPSNSGSCSNMSFVQPNLNQDGQQSGCRLPIFTHDLIYLLTDCFQISYMDYFYQILNMDLVS